MRDVFSWSLAIPWQVRGITVRLHIAYLLFIVLMTLRALVQGYGPDMFWMQVLLFVSVLIHEFGHCFAARQVDGDATEILMWPLGGLASVDVPHTPRANLITTIWGPLMNVFLCLAAAAGLAIYGLAPPVNPFWQPIIPVVTIDKDDAGKEVKKVIAVQTGPVYNWREGAYTPRVPGDVANSLNFPQASLARFFFLNWILFWFNVLLVGFPLDGGRILQAILWPYVGFRQATQVVIWTGYAVGALLLIFAFVTLAKDEPETNLMLLVLAAFIILTCRQQSMLLESGMLGEETPYGDFSQGYTSLERDNPPPRRARPNFIRRWLNNYAEKKRQREEQQRQLDEQRIDDLLAKVAQSGLDSLTSEERRFLTRQSARYRNRHKS
jgi:Zn-dependent protease